MILRNPASEEVKEAAKWEMFPSEWTIGGLTPGNPYRKGNEFGKPGAEFPKMLYKANQTRSGKYEVAQTAPERYGFRTEQEWDHACQSAERFTASCQMVINNETEYDRARSSGWRDDPTAALEHQAALEREVSNAAHERNVRDRNMGELAKAESAAVEAGTFGHVGDVPRQPVKRRGRPRKVTAQPSA